MRLSRGVEVVGMGVYLTELDALIVSDLHIGYEEALAEEGVYLPPVQSAEMRALLDSMVMETGASRVIILGDVKHEFGDVTRQEWRETGEMLKHLTDDLKLRVDVVRGNHDNYLIALLKRLEIPLHDPYLLEGGILFFHGHKPLPLEGLTDAAEAVFMGHEHPAIVLRDELGARVKLKALLEGEYLGKKVLVLPALSPLMSGTEVNIAREMLSPLLREADVGGFRTYAVDVEAGIFDFGLVKHLRAVGLAAPEL